MRIFIATVIIITASFSAKAAFLFHSDGSIIEGWIVKQTATSVTIKPAKGPARTVDGFDIIRIREKIVIKKGVTIFDKGRGELIRSNLVDETSGQYVFRNDISKPDEITVARADALFSKGVHHIEVEGIAGRNDISVEWQEIAGARSYLIFAGRNENLLPLSATESRTQGLVKNLTGNTRYRVALCYIDRTGMLIVPAKDTQFTTENSPPAVPENLKCMGSGAVSGSYTLQWDPSTDFDGTVVGYDIYIKRPNRFEPLGTSQSASFDTPVIEGIGPYMFAVRSVDDRGAASPLSAMTPSRSLSTVALRIEGIYDYPLLSLGGEYARGYGGTIAFEKKDFLRPGIFAGAGVSLIHYKGSDNSKADLFPFMADFGYEYLLAGRVIFGVRLSGGVAYYGGRDASGVSFQRYLPCGSGMLFAGVRAGRVDILLSGGEQIFYDKGIPRTGVQAGLGVIVRVGM